MIYLHIGYPKTGSTSIQTAANNNREELKRANLLYPKSCIVTDGHHNLFYELYREEFDSETLAKMYNPENGTLYDLINEISDWKRKIPNGDTLISSEGIFSLKHKPLSKLIEKLKAIDDVRVIMVLRRQDYWLRSFWSMEVMRLKTSMEPDDWLENDKTFRRLNYNRRVKEIISYIDDLDLQLIGFNEFDKKIILQSFLKIITPQIDLPETIEYSNNLNKSPSDNALSFLISIAHKYGNKLNQKDKIDLVGLLHNKSVKYDWYEKREKTYYRFSKKTLESVSEKYGQSNKHLINKYPNLRDSLSFDINPIPTQNISKKSMPSKLRMLDVNLWLYRRANR